MKPTQNNNKKLSLVKERIATLSGNQMESIVAGQAQGTIGGNTKSSVHDFTCTACTHTSNQTDAGCATK